MINQEKKKFNWNSALINDMHKLKQLCWGNIEMEK